MKVHGFNTPLAFGIEARKMQKGDKLIKDGKVLTIENVKTSQSTIIDPSETTVVCSDKNGSQSVVKYNPGSDIRSCGTTRKIYDNDPTCYKRV